MLTILAIIFLVIIALITGFTIGVLVCTEKEERELKEYEKHIIYTDTDAVYLDDERAKEFVKRINARYGTNIVAVNVKEGEHNETNL